MDMQQATIKWYNNTVINPEPFNAVCNIIGMVEGMKEIDRDYYFNKMDSFAKNCISLFSQFFFMPINIAKAKIVQVDKDLMPSLINTDNKVFYRNTGLPVMFVNQDFYFDKYTLIKGIMIVNAKELAEHMHPSTYLEFALKSPDVYEGMNDLMIMATIIDLSKEVPEENYVGFVLHNRKGKLAEFLSVTACNIIDFMNNNTETIDINVIETDKVANSKRIKRGKVPVPTKVYIRPKSEHRNYYVNFNKELENISLHYSHRFLVRGHWRHYRSDKRKNVQGKSVWIRCSIKGKGIYIEKKYKLEGGKDERNQEDTTPSS